MRIALALPGLHRVNRGAETAFEALGTALARRGHEVTLFGAGEPRAGAEYTFVSSPSVPRERFERWPSFPPLRDSFRYEELSWAPGFTRAFRREDFDVSMTCSFPFTNLAMRLPGRNRPPHVFVTENGDWPAFSTSFEYRFFSCDGIVCTNALYHERNKARWSSVLIPNGVDLDRFCPGPSARDGFDLADGPTVLMVSALNPNKRVDAGIEAVAALDGVNLVVAGDGPIRDEIDALADRLLPGRFRRMSIDSSQMPQLYRSVDAVLHTTFEESFGNVYVEALASGTPLVAHRSPHTEWIVGESPLLVDTGSIEQTSAAIERALSRSDPADTTSMDRFSWSTVAEQYERFLEGIVERSSSRSPND